MQTYQLDNLTITLNKEGKDRYAKLSYPVRYGRYHEIRHPEYLFQFNLSWEIKHIQGLNNDWPHPSEWLKRTVGNDWIYYASGGYAYAGIFDLVGEHYLPCFSYVSNSFFRDNPFERTSVQNAISSWPQLLEKLVAVLRHNNLTDELKLIIKKIVSNNEQALQARARTLRSILQGRISVLPPDTRHVDYEVVPLIIADGCLHNCGFCEVKTGGDFRPRTKEDILRQIRELRNFSSEDIINYNSLFLGQHDGLAAGCELIEYAAENAFQILGFGDALLKEPKLFLFASVDSFLEADQKTFTTLNNLPYHTYINLGLESFDQESLEKLKKPVEADAVVHAFTKMLQVNREYTRLEVTSNIVLSDAPQPGHLDRFKECMLTELKTPYDKGAVYFSPLRGFADRKGIINQFHHFRRLSRLPCYFYLIQRLC